MNRLFRSEPPRFLKWTALDYLKTKVLIYLIYLEPPLYKDICTNMLSVCRLGIGKEWVNVVKCSPRWFRWLSTTFKAPGLVAYLMFLKHNINFIIFRSKNYIPEFKSSRRLTV